jgi:perosamine synthetase
MDVEGVRSFLAEECVVRDGVLTNRTTGRRVSAILPVHVFGTSVDMDPILALAAEYGLAVVEDASESLGSRYKGRMCGTLAPISCLSFNGNKIVTTGGGGAIMTEDDEIARQARYLTTQAKEDGVEYVHNSVGYNYRMNNVLAAIGLAQLENLDERVAIKRANFARYKDALGPSRMLDQPSWSDSNRWFYALLCDSADMKGELMAACAAADVQVRPLWSLNHLQKPYREMQAHRIARAPRFYDTVLNLPCSLSLTPEQIEDVVALVEAADPRRQATPA